MSMTIYLNYYDKNKNGDIIECGKTHTILARDFIYEYPVTNEYPVTILKELKEKFPLKVIDFYEGEGEDKNLHWDIYVLDNEKLDKILEFILLKLNDSLEGTDDFYNLTIIKEILEIKNKDYKNKDNVMINIDYLE